MPVPCGHWRLVGAPEAKDRTFGGSKAFQGERLMDLHLVGHRVLVTAGATGIGLAIARAFIQEGAKVHVCDVDQAELSRLTQTDPRITSTEADVADRDAVARLFQDALDELGGLDVLVNNAGISGPTAFVEDQPPLEWERCINVNLVGQFNCARLAIAPLKESANASIVNMSSISGRLGVATRSPYCASKWGVVGFTKSLAAEVGPHKIRVNAVLPGIVEGDRLERVLVARAEALGKTYDEVREAFLSGNSLRTAVTPEEIADQILFLCSQRARSVSGQAISVCGDLQTV
jgi:NAD(P)-dependent dehydrogenase (short-subunit alcohol dehydrogenase family)